jgi:fatty acid desaturase
MAVSSDSTVPADEFVGRVPVKLAPERLAVLSRTSWLITIAHIALEWGGIVVAIVLCERFWHPLAYVAAVVWIGARQHALVVFMHDGAHVRLCRNRRWNDWLSDVFLAWPVFVTTWAYRENHFAHHRHLNTDGDPDWVRKQNAAWEFPKRPLALASMFARDVLGLNPHILIHTILLLSGVAGFPGQTRNGNTPAYLTARLAYYAVAALLLWRFELGRIFLLYWLVPLATWFMFAMHVRSVAEHFALPHRHVLDASRTTYASWWERLLLIPKNVGYHLDHHLFPSVPFYRLPQLHAELMTQPGFARDAHVTDTYVGVLRECAGARVRPAGAGAGRLQHD